MSLRPHIEEIGKTLDPEYGPESSSEAADRLLGPEAPSSGSGRFCGGLGR